MKVFTYKLKENKFLFALALVLTLMHGLILQHRLSENTVSLPTPVQEKKIILKVLKKQMLRQIVTTEDSNEKLDSEKKYLSRKTNTFKRETVAKKVDSFKKGRPGAKTTAKVKKKTQAKNQEKVELSKLALNPMRVAPKKAQKKLQERPQVRGQQASSNDFVKDIPLGDFTRLNTQEYEFYGFYHRIKQKLEQFWGRNIQEQAQKLAKQGRSIASDSNHVTALEIELNERGEIVNVKVKGASGVKELDTTAVQTFNDAGPFPNPPKKMLRNNRVKINWSFVVAT